MTEVTEVGCSEEWLCFLGEMLEWGGVNTKEQSSESGEECAMLEEGLGPARNQHGGRRWHVRSICVTRVVSEGWRTWSYDQQGRQGQELRSWHPPHQTHGSSWPVFSRGEMVCLMFTKSPMVDNGWRSVRMWIWMREPAPSHAQAVHRNSHTYTRVHGCITTQTSTCSNMSG